MVSRPAQRGRVYVPSFDLISTTIHEVVMRARPKTLIQCFLNLEKFQAGITTVAQIFKFRSDQEVRRLPFPGSICIRKPVAGIEDVQLFSFVLTFVNQIAES